MLKCSSWNWSAYTKWIRYAHTYRSLLFPVSLKLSLSATQWQSHGWFFAWHLFYFHAVNANYALFAPKREGNKRSRWRIWLHLTVDWFEKRAKRCGRFKENFPTRWTNKQAGGWKESENKMWFFFIQKKNEEIWDLEFRVLFVPCASHHSISVPLAPAVSRVIKSGNELIGVHI